MHADDVLTDAAMARRLVDGQFPQWRDLPIVAIAEHGTDHLLYRLGDELLIRLPRIGWAAEQADLEGRWLPVLAPHLPLALPEQAGAGGADRRTTRFAGPSSGGSPASRRPTATSTWSGRPRTSRSS